MDKTVPPWADTDEGLPTYPVELLDELPPETIVMLDDDDDPPEDDTECPPDFSELLLVTTVDPLDTTFVPPETMVELLDELPPEITWLPLECDEPFEERSE